MRLVYAFFANNAELTGDGRLHVFGGDFNTVVAPVMPTGLHLSVVAKIGFDPEEADTHHVIRLEMKSPDGDWTQIPGARVDDFNAGRNELRPELGTNASLIVQVGIQINLPGTFRVRIFVDEQTLAEMPLYVSHQHPQATETSQP